LQMLQCWQNALAAQPVERPEQHHSSFEPREEGCKPLIKNCIICWNYLYLSPPYLRANIFNPSIRAVRNCCVRWGICSVRRPRNAILRFRRNKRSWKHNPHRR
jgi:hypothetical protein